MSFTPGESYYGLTADVYNALVSNFGDAFYLQSYFTPVADGQYYIYSGAWDEFFDFLIEAGLEEEEFYGLQLFSYLNSTWNMGSI